MNVSAEDDGCYVDPRIGAFALFALGVAAAVLGALVTDAPDYARARFTIWPSIGLGGLAVALALNRYPAPWAHAHRPGGYGTGGWQTRAWRSLWGFGYLAYLVHLWFALGGVFEWRLDIAFTAQTYLVTGANLLLLALWSASVVAAWFRLPAAWLHLAAMALFVVATVAATIVFGRSLEMVAAGGLIVAGWIVALALRPSD